MFDILIYIALFGIIIFAIVGLIKTQSAMKRNAAQFRQHLSHLTSLMSGEDSSEETTPEVILPIPEVISPTVPGVFVSSSDVLYPSGSSFSEDVEDTQPEDVEVADESVDVEVVDELDDDDRYSQIEVED